MSNELTVPVGTFNPLALLPQNMKEAKDFADMMSKSILIPKHLQGKPGDCLMITMQAYRWMIDPFVVASCTSTVHGRLCYEGKLIAAVLTTMNSTEGPLEYEIKGEGQGASITVSGTPRGGKKVEKITGTVKGWRTYGKNSDGERIDNNWDKDPISMLVYRGTRQWARLYAPAGFLGVYTPDEIEGGVDEITVTAVEPPSVEVPQRKVAQPVPIHDAEYVEPQTAQAKQQRAAAAVAPASSPNATQATPTSPGPATAMPSDELPFEAPTPAAPPASTPEPTRAQHAEPGDPLTEGMQRILKVTMDRYALTEQDLAREFPTLGKGNISEAMDWVKAHGQAQTQ